MQQTFIEFKKQRETGEIISISFKFLRENYKDFFRLIFKNAGPVFILLIAALVYYSYSTFGSGLGNMFESGGFFISYGILALTLMFYFAVVYTTVFNMIRSYTENQGVISTPEVNHWVREDLAKMFGLNLISGFLVFAGLLLFLIPGVYLSVPLSIATAVMIFERENITGSIYKAFDLVKDNWWRSFGVLLFFWFIIYVVSMIFQLPMVIYTFIKAFTMAQESGSGEEFFDWVYILLMVVSSLIQYLLYTIIPIGVAMVYFHLHEKKHFTGTYERIDNLGNRS